MLRSRGGPVTAPVIDSDVHNDVPKIDALFPYLADYWIEHITNTLFKGPTDTYYPPASPVAARESRQRLANRRMAGQGASAARLDRGAEPDSSAGGPRDRACRGPSWVRAG